MLMWLQPTSWCVKTASAVQILDFNMIALIKEGKLKTPSWLAHLASSAQVEVTCLSFLESVTSPQDGSPGLKAVIDDMTGEHCSVVQGLWVATNIHSCNHWLSAAYITAVRVAT